MASIEMIDAVHKRTAGVKRAKKLSTKVDMTPMVDLGFLLITFFIFTTTMSSPTTMKLIVPKDDINKTAVPESGALTIVIGKNERIYYYKGQLQNKRTNFTKSNLEGIRKVIIDKKKERIEYNKQLGFDSYNLDKGFVVIIKPTKESNYKSIIDVLDEMSINGVRRYAMVNATEEECQFMNAN
jgi:Biopolymer transport protein